jgi:hypothetical protein
MPCYPSIWRLRSFHRLLDPTYIRLDNGSAASMQMNVVEHQLLSGPSADEAPWPILICLLGNFRLLQSGRAVAIPCGGKIETLLGRLGTQFDHRVPRTVLLDLLWPASDSALAHQSLNSLIYSLHKLIGDALGGRP